jgi:hypothetical protein
VRLPSTCLSVFLATGNGKPVSADLRDATKPLLAATARVLGGVLPRHVAPSAAGGGTSDWLWVTGDSPLVATSPCRASFGQADADVVHRNYLAQALHVGHSNNLWLIVAHSTWILLLGFVLFVCTARALT